MKRAPLVLFVALIGLVACGREGPLIGPDLTSPIPTATPLFTPSFETPSPSPSPEESPTPEATASPAPSPESTTPSGRGGVFGSVRVGEERVSDAEVTATAEDGAVAGTVRTDDQGAFRMELAPGNYELTAKSPAVSGCEPEQVTVMERQFHPVQITCEGVDR